jgi:hypothetical protein
LNRKLLPCKKIMMNFGKTSTKKIRKSFFSNPNLNELMISRMNWKGTNWIKRNLKIKLKNLRSNLMTLKEDKLNLKTNSTKFLPMS